MYFGERKTWYVYPFEKFETDVEKPVFCIYVDVTGFLRFNVSQVLSVTSLTESSYRASGKLAN